VVVQDPCLLNIEALFARGGEWSARLVLRQMGCSGVLICVGGLDGMARHEVGKLIGWVGVEVENRSTTDAPIDDF
jgi:hypothetical protein